MALSDKIISVESGGDPDAKNDSSSASGLGQFIDSTWLSTMKAARPDLTSGKSDADIISMKSNPDLQRQMVDAYADQNAALLDKAGVPVTDGTKYLAHFAGPQGAIKVLQADPTASAESVLGSATVKANPFLAKMSAGDVAAWAAKKMGTQSPVTTAAGSAPAPAPVGKPAIFAGQTAQSPQNAAGPSAQTPAAPMQQNAVNTQMLAQNLARLRQSSPIFAGVQNMLGKQNS